MYWNRFDIVEAHYAFHKDYHTGIFSDEYLRLVQITKYYKPGIWGCDYEDLTENGKMIYGNLVETRVNA